MAEPLAPSFHSWSDQALVAAASKGSPGWDWLVKVTRTWQEWSLSADVRPHFHPFVAELAERLVTGSIRGLQDADTEVARNPDGTVVVLPDGTPRPALYAELFAGAYQPTVRVAQPYPVADLTFDADAAYAVYNWELFFHVPVAIAVHLSGNGRYDEAQRWFHYVFDPTDDSAGPTRRHTLSHWT